MDQVLSELIRSWGTFGLIVVVFGFIIWENFIKKDSNQEKHHQSHDAIFTSLLDIKDKLNNNVMVINKTVNSVESNLNNKIDTLESKFNNQIKELEKNVNNIPLENIKMVIEENKKQKIKEDNEHNKVFNDIIKLGGEIYDTLSEYTEKINCQHIFVGSFHNGSNSLNGVPYIKFDIIREVYHPSDVNEVDHDFAPVYKDCNLSLLGKLPNMLVQNKLLYFDVSDQNTEMMKYDQIIPRRMLGLGIKQIALHVTIEDGIASGFVGCVRYDNKKMNLDALELCVKELEIMHNDAKN